MSDGRGSGQTRLRAFDLHDCYYHVCSMYGPSHAMTPQGGTDSLGQYGSGILEYLAFISSAARLIPFQPVPDRSPKKDCVTC